MGEPLLTEKQQNQILRESYPVVPLTPEEAKAVEVGRRIPLEAQVWVEIQGAIRDKKAGWRLDYKVCDHRPRFVRRGLGYTRSIALAVDGVEAVPADYQEELTLEAHRKQAAYDHEHRLEEVSKQDVQRVNAEIRELVKRAIKMGVDPAMTLAPIVKLVEDQHRSLPHLKDAA